MAGEIKVTASIQVDKDTFHFPKIGGSQLSFDQNAVGGGVPGYVSVPAADTLIALTGIVTNGWAYFRNLDQANYVEYGPTAAGAIAVLGKMKPGEVGLIRLAPGVALRMRANTAACKVQILVFED